MGDKDSLRRFKIGIIGAGPAGCTLSRIILHSKASVDLTIFEGEKAFDSRTQGGTLDLHTESGIEALKRGGLYDDFVKLARFDGEAMKLANQDFKLFVNLGGTKDASNTRGRPEIDRIELRRMLLESLPKDIICWDHRLDRVESVNGSYQLQFRNQPMVSGFDLIVGADGAWSHCRDVLSDQKPSYAGMSGVAATISNPEERVAELYKIVNRGSMFSFGNGKSIMSQQLGTGKLSISTWAVQPEETIKQQFDGKLGDPTYIKQTLLKQFDDYSPQLRAFIEAADGDFMSRNLYMLPVGHSWQHKAGITLLGDAAHLMTPFIGEGVNLAMTDAMKLADAIIAASKTGTEKALDQAVEAFEKDMFVRATDYQQRTFDSMKATFFVPGAPDSNIEHYMINVAKDEIPWFIMPLFQAAVYAYFFVWRWRNGVSSKSSKASS